MVGINWVDLGVFEDKDDRFEDICWNIDKYINSHSEYGDFDDARSSVYRRVLERSIG
jgi:hypothetical protein